jgi:hypothetical protein
MDRQHVTPYIVTQTGTYSLQFANEKDLEKFLFAHPQLLPIAEIDPSIAPLIPLCCQMPTGRGFIDTVFINRDGLLTIVECKLWRNQDAKRNVVAQILAYAAALRGWGYKHLQNALTRATQRTGDHLYNIVAPYNPDLAESTFIDNISGNLHRGRLLLLIIGDRIREDVEQIASFLQQHTQPAFGFELIRIHNNQFVVHKPSPPAPLVKAGSPRRKYTREDVLDCIRAQDTILAQRLDEFLDMAERQNLFVDTGTGKDTSSIILRSESSGSALNLGEFRSDLTFCNHGIAKNPKNSKDRKPYLPGETYLRRLASLLPNATVYESVDPFAWTVKKTDKRRIPIDEILDVQDQWLNLISDTLAQFALPRRDPRTG